MYLVKLIVLEENWGKSLYLNSQCNIQPI